MMWIRIAFILIQACIDSQWRYLKKQMWMVHGKSQPYFYFFQVSSKVMSNHLALHFSPSTRSQQADYLIQTAKKAPPFIKGSAAKVRQYL